MSLDLGLLSLAVAGGAVTAVFCYAAYWGFRVREVLLDRLYRERAQWMTVLAVAFAVLAVSNVLTGLFAPTNFYLSLFQFVLQYSGAVITFASIDATIRVAIRTDPLERDTLRWRTFRKILWFVVVVSVAGGFTQVLYLGTNFYTSSGGPQGVLLYGPFGNTFALIALVLARSRSKDYTLRRHMKWFSLFVLIVLVASSDPFYRFASARIGVPFLLFLGAASLYMAAKSLVPVSLSPVPYVESYSAKGLGGGQTTRRMVLHGELPRTKPAFGQPVLHDPFVHLELEEVSQWFF